MERQLRKMADSGRQYTHPPAPAPSTLPNLDMQLTLMSGFGHANPTDAEWDAILGGDQPE